MRGGVTHLMQRHLSGVPDLHINEPLELFSSRLSLGKANRFEIIKIHKKYSLGLRKKLLSGVGFEPTPPFGDQNARPHFVIGRFYDLESGALDRSAILTRMV